MTSIQDIQTWLAALNPESGVAVDDGGLTLVEVGADGKPTENYLEIGGVPDE